MTNYLVWLFEIKYFIFFQETLSIIENEINTIDNSDKYYRRI